MPGSTDPIEGAADSLLAILGEHAEDVMLDVEGETWPLGAENWAGAWEDAARTFELQAHSERAFAKTLRRLIPMLEGAADAADRRATQAD